MENTSEDIKNIYFNENIENYTSKLAIVISIYGSLSSDNNIYIKQLINGNIYYSTLDNTDDDIIGWTLINTNLDWQVNIYNQGSPLTVKFLSNITLNNINNKFTICSPLITINGNNNIFSIINIPNWFGLISVISNVGNINIKNFILSPINYDTGERNGITMINHNSGYLISQLSFQYCYGNNTIDNCINKYDFFVYYYNTGMIGANVFANANTNSINTVQYCTNYGSNIGYSGGGICGMNCFNNDGTNIVKYCVNYGSLKGGHSGGIIGAYGFSTGSNYNYGGIDIIYGTQITGTRVIGVNNLRNIVSNCVNYGTIQQTHSPIYSNTYVKYTLSNFFGGGGGICGYACFRNNIKYNTIENCENHGNITFDTTVIYTLNYEVINLEIGTIGMGGITGRNCFTSSSTNLINNCFNSGNIGRGCSGIAGIRSSICNIENCYSTGQISSIEDTSGISSFSVQATGSGNLAYTLTINNCYTLYGNIFVNISQYITSSVYDIILINKSKCYESLGTWVTDTARSNLLIDTDAWGYNKVGNATITTDPFVLLSLNPTNVSVLTGLTCFNKDTKILTNNGYILIQDLKKGDLIKTLLHGFVPIHTIGYRDIYNSDDNEIIKDKLFVYSNSVYDDLIEDLILTGGHSVLVDEIKGDEEIKVRKLFGKMLQVEGKYRLPAYIDNIAKPYTKEGTYTVYHLALEHDNDDFSYGIYANGLLVESCSIKYLRHLD
jgi:hypothetical protein